MNDVIVQACRAILDRFAELGTLPDRAVHCRALRVTNYQHFEEARIRLIEDGYVEPHQLDFLILTQKGYEAANHLDS